MKDNQIKKKGNAKDRGLKSLKRTFYKSKVLVFQKSFALLFIVGIAAALLYFLRYAYIGYAQSKAEIVLSYPEIAQSRHPDGSRFTYYEFISDDNISKALDKLHEEGKYENFTVDDLRNQFFLHSQLEGSAGASVSSSRSEGNDFSFVANEYKLTFVQPHDYKNSNIFEKVFTTDYSMDFLKELVDVNRRKIAEKTGGVNGFRTLVSVGDISGCDYSEKLSIYRTKIRAIKAYIRYINNKDTDFVSAKYDMTLKDIESKYNFLVANEIDSISSFVESSGLSKNVEITSNKIKVNIENNTLKFNKYADRSATCAFAMQNYDQTFTENLINVVRDEDYGLYQARPKTAFDKVVIRMNEANENVATYRERINQFNNDLTRYSGVATNTEEYARLINKCEELMESFEQKYKELSDMACEIMVEYHNKTNENYIKAKIRKKSIFTQSLVIRMGLAFLLGAVIAFMAEVFINTLHDSKELKRKKKMIKEIKKAEKE